MDSKRMAKIGWFIVIVAVFNFVCTMIHVWVIGGGSVQGANSNGEYTVRFGSQFTSVSRCTWWVLFIHQISSYVTHVLGTFVGPPLIVISRRKAELEAVSRKDIING